MKKSIFRKITLIILLVVLVVDSALLVVSYKIAYNRSYQRCVDQLQHAIGVVEEMLAFFRSTETDTDTICNSMTRCCKNLELPYIYAFEVDTERSLIRYLAIGFGDEATEVGRTELYPGAEIEMELPEELMEVYEGRAKRSLQHVKNQYGETLICYSTLEKKYDAGTDSFVTETGNPVMIGVDISLSRVMDDLARTYNIMSILLIGLSIAIVLACALILYRKISVPIRRISDRMSGFVEDYAKGIQTLPVKGEDELAEVSRSFNTMAENIHTYLGNIEELNREKHTRQAELDIATNIQKGLLGDTEYVTESFRIDACMTPAKEVGGDLYDYLVLDDGRIFLTIADVSGKGISASLFMSRAVTLLHIYAKMNLSPAGILKEFNDSLSAYNPGKLFITVFVAIYDPVTKELTYSNGGHNVPYVISDRLIPLEEGRGIASGIFPGEDFKEATIRLKEGDTVFLYTDGVNEAISKDVEFYSVERLEERLTDCIGKEENPLMLIRKDLSSFTEGAVQSDDITMLTLKILTGDTILHLMADLSELHRVKEAVLSLPVSEDMQKKLYLAADEIFTNICSYAYDQSGDVEVKITMGDNNVEMIFRDSGRPFDPTKDILKLEDYDYEHEIGGLGRFLTFTIADDFRYEYTDKKNVLWLKFMI